LAAKKLGAMVINIDVQRSSVQKGENLLDTVKNLQAMGVDAFIIRHPQEGTSQFIAENIQAKVINAGDGTQSHPTQALIDAFTIKQFKSSFDNLSIALVGDIRHSRVANSNIEALSCLGVRDIRLIGPKDFLPPNIPSNCVFFQTIEEGLKEVDVIMMLRIQKERMQRAAIPDSNAYFENFGLTQTRLRYAKPEAIVMHPGPMNRGVEIESSVADGLQSVILEQVKNGIYIRMAVLKQMFTR
jgi:aspartate carbamoyltransferase catalytic subunit